MGLADVVESELDSSTTNDIEDYVPGSYVCRGERGNGYRGHNESLLHFVCNENVNGILAYEQPVVETIMKLLKRLHGYLTASV